MYPEDDLYTDTDTTDTDGLVVNNHVFGLLISWCSNVVNDWYNAGSDGEGEYRHIDVDIPKEIVKKLREWKATYKVINLASLDNVRFWGSTVRDYWRIGH